MALIECPGCSEQISDKAKKCVHCGYVLVEEEKKVCSECGAELEAGTTVCPKCGCPVEEKAVIEEEKTPQQVEITKVNIKPKNSKKIITVVAIAVVAIIAIIFGVKANAAKESKSYGSKLESTSDEMLKGAAKAETCCNLIKSVWYNTIYEKEDSSTDEYTKPDGRYFNDDFNTSLMLLFSDDDFQSDITEIQKNQTDVAEHMKELKNPPDEWADAYEELEEYYDAYLTLTNLAVDPTGTLQTYSNEFSDADSSVSNYVDKMKMYF